MTSRSNRPPWPRAVVPWIVLGVALMLVTEPVWSMALFGFRPGLDELLTLRCFARPEN